MPPDPPSLPCFYKARVSPPSLKSCMKPCLVCFLPLFYFSSFSSPSSSWCASFPCSISLLSPLPHHLGVLPSLVLFLFFLLSLILLVCFLPLFYFSSFSSPSSSWCASFPCSISLLSPLPHPLGVLPSLVLFLFFLLFFLILQGLFPQFYSSAFALDPSLLHLQYHPTTPSHIHLFCIILFLFYIYMY